MLDRRVFLGESQIAQDFLSLVMYLVSTDDCVSCENHSATCQIKYHNLSNETFLSTKTLYVR